MLHVTIPALEHYNEGDNTFYIDKAQHLQLEHSLVSLSKWESKWCKPFLSADGKSVEECIDYLRCMTLTQNVEPNVYKRVTQAILDQVNQYIEAPMTATWFNERENKTSKKEIVTAEIIYYWMIALNIPFECQKWHLNKLLTLIKVCNLKNSPQKKMSRKELNSRNKSLNAARRNRVNSRG